MAKNTGRSARLSTASALAGEPHMMIPSVHVDVPGGMMGMGGKPSRGTKRDRRLKTNKRNKRKRKKVLRWL